MKGSVTWNGESNLTCTNAAGKSVEIDWKNGPTPMDLTLQMIAGCSIVDVVVGMKDRQLDECWVELEAERAEEAPRVFTKVEMVYHVKGQVPQKLVERVVAKSHEKYCSVSNMIHHTADITWRVELHN